MSLHCKAALDRGLGVNGGRRIATLLCSAFVRRCFFATIDFALIGASYYHPNHESTEAWARKCRNNCADPRRRAAVPVFGNASMATSHDIIQRLESPQNSTRRIRCEIAIPRLYRRIAMPSLVQTARQLYIMRCRARRALCVGLRRFRGTLSGFALFRTRNPGFPGNAG